MAGMLTVFTKGLLCNWMVSLAVVFAFATTSLSGKILAISVPPVLFLSQGFEHAVVNMFVIPVGMLLGAHVTLMDWWLGTRSLSRSAIWSGACCSPVWPFILPIVLIP